MNRWSTLASDDAATSATQRGAATASAAGRAGWARSHAASVGFATPIEHPRTIPSPAAPDPRRTLNLETAPPRLDVAIEWLLIGLLAFMPFALGVVAPWSETDATASGSTRPARSYTAQGAPMHPRHAISASFKAVPRWPLL